LSSGFAGRGLRQGYNALALLHSNAVCFLLRARERGGGRCSRFSALSRAKFWPHEGQVVGGRRRDAGAHAWNVGSRHVRERVASNNELYGIRRGASWQCGWGRACVVYLLCELCLQLIETVQSMSVLCFMNKAKLLCVNNVCEIFH